MAVMLEAQRLRSQGVDVIDLGPGQPDFPTPEPIKRAGIDAIVGDFTRYTASSGIDELRAALANSFNRRWGTRFEVENVVVCAGAKQAVFSLCMAAFQEGDEVVIPAPYWVTFPEVVKLAGAAPVFLPTLEEHRFIPDIDALRECLTDRTRGLILNTPNNPTGAVIPGPILERLVALTRDKGLFLISDETYEQFTYDGREHVSVADFIDADTTGFAVVGSFSKTHAMTGWRVGYCLGHAALMTKIGEFQSHQSGNPCSISQRAALAALAGGEEDVEAMRREYERRRGAVLNRLESLDGFDCVPPEGTFYVFPNVREAMSRVGCASSVDFCRFLLREARVATVPGSAFGAENYLRLSYAAPLDRLEAAFDRLEEALSHR